MAQKNIPSVLAYERSIQPSIGLMYSLVGTTETPLRVMEEKLRGVISDFKSGNNLEKNIGNPNLQTIDVARLATNSDTLIVKFNIVFLNQTKEPLIHNAKDNFAELLKEFSFEFKKINGYIELAKLYFRQIKNGSWLWRNLNIKQTLEINFFPSFDDEELINKISLALSGEIPFMLNIVAKLKIGENQEVYPSQEFSESKEFGADGREKSKVLAKLNDNQAYLHSQKIGNAIRTIDEWYNEYAIDRPIAVEPFGVNQALQKAFRKPTDKTDLYTYLSNLQVYIDELKKDILSNESKFIMACLIRGGVFGGPGKEK